MIKVYQWSALTNWGDKLSVPLLNQFAGLLDVAVETGDIDEADLTCVGSVIGHLPNDYQGYVLGSGALMPGTGMPYRAKVWGVRGHLSLRHHRRLSRAVVLGDPGLIADELVPAIPRVHKLGILPHWSDNDLRERREFWRYDPLFIDPRRDPLLVISDILSCDKLVTSSLHGMIVADSVGIPRRFEYTPRLNNEGATFKHTDYSMSIGAELHVGVTQAPDRNKINDVRDRIKDMLEEFGHHWNERHAW